MESLYEKEKKHTFSNGGLGTDDGKEQHIPAGQVGSSLPPEPSVAWRRSLPWGCWQDDCVRAKGAGLLLCQGGQRAVGLSEAFWGGLSPPHSFEDTVGKHQEARVTFALSPPGPDTDTWWRQVWAHLQLDEALEPD